MNSSELIFCVECKMVLNRGSAEIIFKTGFYKSTMPLGHCKNCACASKNIEIDMVSVSGQGYLDNSVASLWFA